MDDVDTKILEAINTVSPKYFISPIRVNEILRLDITELGNRLILLKRSGHVDIMTSEYISSQTLPNFISKVHITESGRKCLKKKR